MWYHGVKIIQTLTPVSCPPFAFRDFSPKPPFLSIVPPAPHPALRSASRNATNVTRRNDRARPPLKNLHTRPTPAALVPLPADVKFRHDGKWKPGPIPFLQKPISKIKAPFPPNLLLKSPDFPSRNLFSQAHFLWQSHTFCQRDTNDWSRTGHEEENGAPGGTFLFLQKTLASSPDSDRALAIRSVFCSKRPIRKGHSPYRSMLSVNPTGSSEPGGREGRHQLTFEGAR
jgi:hypothetical protein